MLRRITLVALLLMLSVSTSFAQISAVPKSMNFQGRFATPSGNPVPDGTANLELSIYNALTGGTLWWQRVLLNVPVRNGVFATTLDFSGGYQNGATQSSVFAASALFLEIRVNGGLPLAPRTSLVTVPYAFKADLALTVPDGSITNSKIAAGTLTADRFAIGAFNGFAWLLGGNSATNPATNFLGTTDNNPLEFRVNNHRAMRYSYAENTASIGSEYRSINVLGGSEINSISAGVVGATIAGGGEDSFTLADYPNRVTNNYGTISGGYGNSTSGYGATVAGGIANTASGNSAAVGGGSGNSATNYDATVAGGNGNRANGDYATVAGGYNNNASGYGSTVAGGDFNTAAGDYSFAAGRSAKANHGGTFVWADSTNSDFASTNSNQFLIRASGGVGINTNNPGGTMLHVVGQVASGIGYKRTDAKDARISVSEPTQTWSLASGWATAGDFSIIEEGAAGNRLYIQKTTGNVGIGTSVPAYKLHVNGSVAGVGNYNNVSDRRYKTHIETFPDALDVILNLRGVTFDWRQSEYPNMNFSKGTQIGFIAQEVEKVLPQLVSTDANGYKSVAYANVVPVAVEAIKAQQSQISLLRKQIDALKDSNGAIAKDNAELRNALNAMMKRLDALERQNGVNK